MIMIDSFNIHGADEFQLDWAHWSPFITLINISLNRCRRVWNCWDFSPRVRADAGANRNPKFKVTPYVALVSAHLTSWWRAQYRDYAIVVMNDELMTMKKYVPPARIKVSRGAATSSTYLRIRPTASLEVTA